MAISQNYDDPLPTKRVRLNQGVVKPVQPVGSVQCKQNDLPIQRANLPIYIARSEIVEHIKNNSCTIIIGETGSGKTTQIPQFIFERGLHKNGSIYITQPRRVAAISLSMRVAEEMGCELGKLVGYSVRFDALISEETVIQYMTDGMLLREAMRDPLLKKTNVVIMDEVHERTLHTDVTLGIVKRAQKLRSQKLGEELKIVVMSATMNVDHFSVYFDNAPVVYVEGRQYPVQIMYAAQQITDYFHSTLVTIFQLHNQEPAEKDFLVFLTGQDEIEQAVRKIRLLAKELPANKPKINILPLYSALTPQVQMRVFMPKRNDVRKIILATNIAETSITIPGVRIVIDCGKVKSRLFEPSKGIDMLRVVNISKAQANQRAGRSGREAPGFCYRLYREIDYESYSESIQPEILRCNLSSVILELLAMKITNIASFDFMSKPSPEAILNAVRQLEYLNAVEKQAEDILNLTQAGRRMTNFPLDPKLSRIILASEQLGCVEEALTAVSLMSCDRITINNSTTKKEECESVHRKFFAAEGDLIFHMNVYKAYKHSKGNKCKEWCQENFVHQRNAEMVEKVRSQLRDICLQHDIALSSCFGNNEPLRKALCYGMFLQAADLDPSGTYKVVDTGLKAIIHPSSCLFQHKPGFVIYNDLMLTNQLYLRDVTLIDPRWLIDAAPEYFKSKHLKFV